jgi:nucleotide-binding universal stress UspA family protein
MTIIAGFSSSRQGTAPLNLAAQIARSSGDKIIATAIVERPWPPKGDPIEGEYLRYVTSQASEALERVISRLPADLDISVVVHQSTSIPAGLMELAVDHQADVVVVGSSSSGLLGRVALGSVTERLVHTAAVPVAIAPRGYPLSPDPVYRLTAAYGGAADAVGLIATSAELAKRWSVRLRIASFTVRPLTMFRGTIEPSAEDLVVQEWSRRTFDEITKQLNDARARISVPDVDVVIGAGHDWGEAVNDIFWEAGDILLLGSGAAGQATQVFLGSAASKDPAPCPGARDDRSTTTGFDLDTSAAQRHCGMFDCVLVEQDVECGVTQWDGATVAGDAGQIAEEAVVDQRR